MAIFTARAKINFIPLYTGPKMRFPIRFVFQNVTFPHISYTYLAEDRATFHANEGKVEKILPYPTDFLQVGNSNFYVVIISYRLDASL